MIRSSQPILWSDEHLPVDVQPPNRLKEDTERTSLLTKSTGDEGKGREKRRVELDRSRRELGEIITGPAIDRRAAAACPSTSSSPPDRDGAVSP